MLILLLISMVTVPTEAALAPTWDYCNCRWDNWETWSDCSSTCFGRRYRERSVWITQNDGCDEFTDCATRDEGIEYQDCNNVCLNGGVTSGLYWPPCSCTLAYNGKCCGNRVTCGYPGTTQFGTVTYSDTFYGSVARYECNRNFNMTSGDSTRLCQSNSVWSGQKPMCTFANNCSSIPCQNGAECVNLLNDFACNCKPGWSGKSCDSDIQPPVVNNCPNDVYINATERTVQVEWGEPTFDDPMGTTLEVTSNYMQPQFLFPWGDFVVQYVAFKPTNGMKTECAFNIKIRPTPCNNLNVPINGARICNNWATEYGQFCFVACRRTFTINISRSYANWFVCGASGTWISSAPLPDCDFEITAPEDVLAYQPDYVEHSFLSCEDAQSTEALKQLYIEKLNRDRFSDFCRRYPTECTVNNVNVKCL